MISDDHIQLFFDRFVTRRDCYNQQMFLYNQKKHEMEFKVPVVYEPCTLDVVRQHLLGEITIAFPAFDEHGLCPCPVWDCDNDGDWLDRIERVLVAAGFSVIRCGRRPGRAGHLRLLLDRPIPAAAAIRFDQEIRAHAGVPYGAVEFFPKQSSAEKVANAIRAPLGIHRKPGAGNVRGWFDGSPHDLNEQLGWLAAQPLNSAEKILQIVERLSVKDAGWQRYTRNRIIIRSDCRTDNLELLNHLNPDVRRGNYCTCDCPNCGNHEAYFYLTGDWITCNRRRECKFSMSIDRYLEQHKNGSM